MIMSDRATSRLGFTLLELSVVLTILGILVSGGLVVGANMVKEQSIIGTRNDLDVINDAISKYVYVNKRLPCVAPITAALNSATFGVEITPGGVSCDANTTTPAGTFRVAYGAGQVRIGMLPTRTLGLPDRVASDKYGNRYLYAVTESNTSTTGFATAANDGVIRVQDLNGNPITTTASFVVVSPGENGLGAYKFATGAIPTACGGTGEDAENCNNDGVFADGRYNDGSTAANYFDDTVSFTPKFVLQAGGTSTDGLWRANGVDIYAVGTDGLESTGNVGIGTSAGGFKLSMFVPNTNDGILENGNGNYLGMIPKTTLGGWSALTQADDSVIFYSGASGVNTGGLTIGQWSSSERGIRIAPNGNVGVGIGVPQTQLQVGNGTSNGQITHFGTAPGTVLRDSNGRSGAVVVDNSAMYFMRGATAADSGTDGFAQLNGAWPLAIDLNTSWAFFGSTVRIAIGDLQIGNLDTAGADTGSKYSTAIRFGGATNTNNDQIYFVRYNPALDQSILFMVLGEEGDGNDQYKIVSAGLDRFIFNSNGNFQAAGSITSSGGFMPSDARLKEDIQPLAQSGIEIIEKLAPSSYAMKKDHKKAVGFIAQDVQKILPELVQEFTMISETSAINGATDPAMQDPSAQKEKDQTYLSLNYVGLIPYMTKAIQELKHEQDALKSEVAALKAEISTLKGGTSGGASLPQWVYGLLGLLSLGLVLLGLQVQRLSAKA